MSDPTPTRPRQVTLAGWMLMVGSALAVLLVFDRLSGLHSLESQEAVRRFLDRPPGSGLGLEVDGALGLIRTAAMITAGCATAAGILGFHVLRRSRSARLAVTILAVPIFLAGTVTGGFVTSVVAASAAVLWLQPARSWFRGEAPPERPASEVAPPAAGPGQPAVRPRSDRPGGVLWACVLTWVATGVTILGLLASGVVLAVRSDAMLEEARRQNPDLSTAGVSDNVLVVATYALIGGLALWCIAAAVLAVLVLRRVAWARIVLIVSAAVASAGCLVGAAVGAFVLLIPLGAAVATIALLMRADVGAWFTRPPGPPQPGGAVPPR